MSVALSPRPAALDADPAAEITSAAGHKHGHGFFAREPFAPAMRQGRALGVALGLLAGGLLAGLAAPVPAMAQLTSRDQGEVLGPGDISRDVDPYPFDARIALAAFLRKRLPSQWWAGDPTYEFGGLRVEIHVPEIWRGNPTGAMESLCPPIYDEIWRSVQVVELRPIYQKARWSSTICRR